jgi:hypothetical protein
MAIINPVVCGKSLPDFSHAFDVVYRRLSFQGHRCVCPRRVLLFHVVIYFCIILMFSLLFLLLLLCYSAAAAAAAAAA